MTIGKQLLEITNQSRASADERVIEFIEDIITTYHDEIVNVAKDGISSCIFNCEGDIRFRSKGCKKSLFEALGNKTITELLYKDLYITITIGYGDTATIFLDWSGDNRTREVCQYFW